MDPLDGVEVFRRRGEDFVTQKPSCLQQFTPFAVEVAKRFADLFAGFLPASVRERGLALVPVEQCAGSFVAQLALWVISPSSNRGQSGLGPLSSGYGRHE